MTSTPELLPAKFIVLVSSKDRRAYDPFELAERLIQSDPEIDSYDKIRQAFGFSSEVEAKENGTTTLTRTQCLELQAAFFEFYQQLGKTRNNLRSVAELMRFFHIPYREVLTLSIIERIALTNLMEQIRARERLAFQEDVSTVLSSGDRAREIKLNLAQIAFSDDPETLLSYQVALTNKV